MNIDDIERMISGDATACDEALAQIRAWKTRAEAAERKDVVDTTRDAEWCRAVRSIVIEDAFYESDSDDPKTLRECLARQQLCAAMERQCAATRSAVVDVYDEVLSDGRKAVRFCVATATGDLGEVRELARALFAAWSLASGDVERALKNVDVIVNGGPGDEA